MMKTLCLMDSVSRANGGIFEADFDRHIKKVASRSHERNRAFQHVRILDFALADFRFLLS